MKPKLIIVFLLLIFIYSQIGCVDKGASSIAVYMKNTSGHDLEVFYYRNGVVDFPGGGHLNSQTDKSIKLRNGEALQIDSGSDFGKIKGPFVLQADSALVVYEGHLIAYHYGLNVNSTKNPKAILPTNARNIFNDAGYSEVVIRETENSFWGEYTYTFTEQDYLNAK